MKSIDACIAYYTKKVAFYSSIHFMRRPKRWKYRADRLLYYKARMHELIRSKKGGVNMLENPIIEGHCYEETYLTPNSNGVCNHRHCDERVYTKEGIEFDDRFFCSPSCLGEYLLDEGSAIDLSA